jgi:hypothetical protein
LIHRDSLARKSATVRNKRRKEHPMLDIVMLALALGLFAAGISYAYACERL